MTDDLLQFDDTNNGRKNVESDVNDWQVRRLLSYDDVDCLHKCMPSGAE